MIVDGELDEVRKLRRKNAWELPVLHGTEAPMADAARVLVVKVATEKAVTLADEPARDWRVARTSALTSPMSQRGG